MNKSFIVIITICISMTFSVFGELLFAQNKRPSGIVKDKRKIINEEIKSADPKEKKEKMVNIVGKGDSRELAIKDAIRNAVEKSTGIFMYSVSEVQNFEIEKDKITSASEGFVSDYKIIEENNIGGIYFITAKVLVNTGAIKKIMRDNINVSTYEDALKDYTMVAQRQERLRRYAEMLELMKSRPITERYIVDYAGYELVKVGLNEVEGRVKFKIFMNPFFWETYYDVISQVSDQNQKLCYYSSYKGEERLRSWDEEAEKNQFRNYKKYIEDAEGEINKLTLQINKLKKKGIYERYKTQFEGKIANQKRIIESNKKQLELIGGGRTHLLEKNKYCIHPDLDDYIIHPTVAEIVIDEPHTLTFQDYQRYLKFDERHIDRSKWALDVLRSYSYENQARQRMIDLTRNPNLSIPNSDTRHSNMIETTKTIREGNKERKIQEVISDDGLIYDINFETSDPNAIKDLGKVIFSFSEMN